MSEFASSFFTEQDASSATATLNPEAVENLLEDFRDWLSVHPTPIRMEAPAPRTISDDASPDLFALLGQMTALRQEVNLQTRAVRAQQEQNGATLTTLTQALEVVRQAQAAAAPNLEAKQRPLLKTLIELHDALSVADREVQRVQDSILPSLEIAPEADDPAPPVVVIPTWARWLGQREPDLSAWQAFSDARRERDTTLSNNLDRVKQMVGSLLSGYGMSLQRVERAMKQHGLEAIPALGEPFDAEFMEVVEAVHDSGAPNGEVLEEVRRGYMWNGRVFRFAQVRVAKS